MAILQILNNFDKAVIMAPWVATTVASKNHHY